MTPGIPRALIDDIASRIEVENGGAPLSGGGQGTVVWLTGLSGAGKSSIGEILLYHFRQSGHPVARVDGDVVRAMLPKQLGHTPTDRRWLARCFGEICRELSLRGLNVVCATISLFHEAHNWNRSNIANYVEVYLRVPIEELRRRDPKGLYARQEAGEDVQLVGVSQPAEEPITPDLLIEFNERDTPVDSAARIWSLLGRRYHHLEQPLGRSKSLQSQTKWDYTSLAAPYLNRPNYSKGGIDAMLAITGIAAGARVCDVGAGVGHLTVPLAEHGYMVTAVEPNGAMRALGTDRTAGMASIKWRDGTGEKTGLDDRSFELVTFGSSFNVTDRQAALQETRRILRSKGWFACMWNHRDLNDPLQQQVEATIKSYLPSYDYGARREDQAGVIAESGLFERCHRIESPVMHEVAAVEWAKAWLSHATLQRQAGAKFEEIVQAIERKVIAMGESTIKVPYTTRIWVAQAL